MSQRGKVWPFVWMHVKSTAAEATSCFYKVFLVAPQKQFDVCVVNKKSNLAEQQAVLGSAKAFFFLPILHSFISFILPLIPHDPGCPPAICLKFSLTHLFTLIIVPIPFFLLRNLMTPFQRTQLKGILLKKGLLREESGERWSTDVEVPFVGQKNITRK